MGADIHLWTEKKEDGKWNIVENIDIHDLSWYQEMLDENREKGETSRWKHMSEDYLLKSIEAAKKPREQWLYSGRNYNLFSILANVRNGRGFAGVKTGEGFNPISEPKGVPKDASTIYQEQVESWDCDGHSHSYLTLKELKEYDWNQTTTLYGVVSEDYYKELKETGEPPTSYSGGVSGRGIEVVSEDYMLNILISDELPYEGGLRGKNVEYYVRMKWNVKYKDTAQGFYEDSIKALEELSGSKDQDDVRIVFFFDN